MPEYFTGIGVRLGYNPPLGWGFAEVNNGGHVASWILATNNENAPVIFVCGQREDNTLRNAQQNNTFDGLDLTELPFQEMVPIARLIFQTSNGYGNAPKARIRDYQDLRGTTNIRGASYVPVNHQSLSGREEDGHLQYFLGGIGTVLDTLAGDEDDYEPTGLQATGQLRLNTDGADYDITGIVAPDGTYRINNKMLIIVNVDAAQTITLKNEDAASVAANRMALGSDLALAPYQSALIWYDATSSRWRPLGGGGGGGVVSKAIDHTWEGDNTNSREIDLSDDYDLVLIFLEEDKNSNVNHLAMAYAFKNVYGVFVEGGATNDTKHLAMASSDTYWQGKMTGADANKILLSATGNDGRGTNYTGRTYRLVGLKFSSME